MFYWSVVARYGELHHEKIIMKDELKHIPGPGKSLSLGISKGEHGGGSLKHLLVLGWLLGSVLLFRQ